MTPGQRDPTDCSYPPHPGHHYVPGLDDDADQDRLVSGSSIGHLAQWVRYAPAERLPLLGVPAVWTAAEILHAASVSGVFPGAATAAAAGIAYGTGERRALTSEYQRLSGRELAATAGALGAWMTAATVWGPLAGPEHLLSLVYTAGAVGGYWWLRRHAAVRGARQRRQEQARRAAEWAARKAWWHRLAPRLGLHGSHLLAYDQTLLGESLLIDTRGTGHRASRLATRDLAERIGEIEMIPLGRIDVTTDKIPGRLRVNIRRTDPWADPIPHPLTVASSPYAKYTAYPASIRDPQVIGIDPETGQPLGVALWTPKGGRVILIAGKKDAGKTVLLNNLTERITACPDAVLLQINLSKVREDDIWSPLAEVSALADVGKSRRTLAFSVEGIKSRSRGRRRTTVHQPTPGEPLFVVKIDEIDAVASDAACREDLGFIASKCRSEGWALIIAGQRATAQWIGGADLRANVDLAIWGKFARAAEARHIGGAEIDLPDMGAYGEGASGVFGITELGGGGDYDRGRTFYLHQIDDLENIVAGRLPQRRPYQLEPALAHLDGMWAKITRVAGPGDSPDDASATAPGLSGRSRGPRHSGDGQDHGEDPMPAGRYDASGVRAKLATALATGTEPSTTPLAAEAEEAIAEYTGRRKQQALAQYADIALPEADQAALRHLLAAPDGTTTRAAAAELPGHWSHTQVHRQLLRWQAEGTAEKHGHGSRQRWHNTPSAGRHLHAVPDPGPAQGTSGDGHRAAP